MKLDQKAVIFGIIMPHNWDETGRIIEIALYTSREEVYTVERNSLTEELMSFIHQRVEIRGKIRENPTGRKSIDPYNCVAQKEILNNDRCGAKSN